MQRIEPITYGKFFHIYNRGVDGCTIFHGEDDYEFFLKNYARYIELVADTFAWCLMGNHLHLLVRIKENVEIKSFEKLPESGGLKTVDEKWGPLSGSTTTDRDSQPTPPVAADPDGGNEKNGIGTQWQTRKPRPSNQFSHLFNSYTQAFNRKYKRHGPLFERPFKRKLIESEAYLKQSVLYIHNNPVHHSFCERPEEYHWSSYAACVSIKPTRLHRKEVVGWFNDHANFIAVHRRSIDREKIEEWLKING